MMTCYYARAFRMPIDILGLGDFLAVCPVSSLGTELVTTRLATSFIGTLLYLFGELQRCV